MERREATRLSHAVAVVTLEEQDLPAIYRAADQNSSKAQTGFLVTTGVSLALLVVAAGAGAFTWQIASTGTTDWMGVIAAVAFAVAGLLRFNQIKSQPEKKWYDGRAVAESVKTLAWRYSVGAEPFGIERNPSEADDSFLDRLQEIWTNLGAASLVPPSTMGSQITPAMRALREKPLDERKEAYQTDRIENQIDWYRRKAQENDRAAKRWNFVLLAIEALGVLGAVLKATGTIEVDLLGFVGAVVAAGTSWLQAKQHSNLAEAYSVTAHELSAISDRISSQNRDTWARFVDEAEEAISREHTLWRASRTSV